MDSIQLEEIIATSDYYKFQTGSKIESINIDAIGAPQEGGIEQVLMRYTPVYIKTNAGGLSTIRLRGTAPDHTNIMFGGININSLTLGHSNLSNITTFLFDKLKLQYGSSAALNGSGAIGGIIYLEQYNHWTDGLRTEAKLSLGSFGEKLYGAKVYAGNGKFESLTKVLQYKNNNDFPFLNPYHNKTISHPGPIEDIQKGSAINNRNILQKFSYLINPNAYVKSMFWYADSWHEVQPSMQSNFSYKGTQELSNTNFRFWNEYKNENHQIKLNIGAGFAHDKQVYDDDISQVIQTDRLITDFSFILPIARKIEMKSGIKFKHIVPTVYSYADSNIHFEQHLDLYTALVYQANKKLNATINLRQGFVSNYHVPFTPAIGVNYKLFSNSLSKLNTTFNASRIYRVPTFNDRFWGTQGKPNQSPEDGISLEFGLIYQYLNDQFQSRLKVNAYYMNINNWIEWRNQGVWVPFNLDKVISKGIELSYKAKLDIGNFNSGFNANYSFNPAIKIEEDRPNQQTIYTPKNMVNVSSHLKYQSFSLFLDGSYTGSRYFEYSKEVSELNNRGYMKDYLLFNSGFRYDFAIKNQAFKYAFSCNNIFNTQYQNERYYAMPGRNFRISISTKINVFNNNN